MLRFALRGVSSAKKASKNKIMCIYLEIHVFICFSKKTFVVYHYQGHDQGHDHGHDHDQGHDQGHDHTQGRAGPGPGPP